MNMNMDMDVKMNIANAEERTTKSSRVREKIFSILKKIIIALLVSLAVVFALVVIYQVLEVLFVLAVLIVGCISPRRW